MKAAIVNPNGRYNRVTEACSQTNWSRNTLMRVANEANAVVRVGRTVRIDMPILFEYIDRFYKN